MLTAKFYICNNQIYQIQAKTYLELLSEVGQFIDGYVSNTDADNDLEIKIWSDAGLFANDPIATFVI